LEEIAVLMPDLDKLAGRVVDRLARTPWHEGRFPVYVAGGLPLTHFAAGAQVLAVVSALQGQLTSDNGTHLTGQSCFMLSATILDLCWHARHDPNIFGRQFPNVQ